MKLYQSILRRSWKITKAHHLLWVYGFFAIIWIEQGIDFELIFSNLDLLQAPLSPFNPEFWDVEQWRLLAEAVGLSGPVIAIFSVGMIVLIVCALLFAILSQIGLIDAYNKYDTELGDISSKRKSPQITDDYTLTHTFTAAQKHFWPIVGVNILGHGFRYALLAGAVLPFFLPTISPLVAWALLLLFTPIMILVSIVTRYATNAVIVNNQPTIKAFSMGIEIFKRNVGISIELAVLMIISYTVVNMLTVAVVFIVTAPLVAFSSALFIWAGLYDILAFIGLFSGLLVFAGLTMTSSLFASWHSGNWTILFKQLTTGSKQSKIYRLWKGE